MAKACTRDSRLDLLVASEGTSIAITTVPEAAGAPLVIHHYGLKEGLRRALDHL
jgi:hypothetical protein